MHWNDFRGNNDKGLGLRYWKVYFFPMLTTCHLKHCMRLAPGCVPWIFSRVVSFTGHFYWYIFSAYWMNIKVTPMRSSAPGTLSIKNYFKCYRNAIPTFMMSIIICYICCIITHKWNIIRLTRYCIHDIKWPAGQNLILLYHLEPSP